MIYPEWMCADKWGLIVDILYILTASTSVPAHHAACRMHEFLSVRTCKRRERVSLYIWAVTYSHKSCKRRLMVTGIRRGICRVKVLNIYRHNIYCIYNINIYIKTSEMQPRTSFNGTPLLCPMWSPSHWHVYKLSKIRTPPYTGQSPVDRWFHWCPYQWQYRYISLRLIEGHCEPYLIMAY